MRPVSPPVISGLFCVAPVDFSVFGSVGKCLLYVRFYLKKDSNKILKNIIFRGPNLKMTYHNP